MLEAQQDETPEAKRRRHLANIQAGAPLTTGDPGSSKDPNAPPPSALVLADPSREYVLYFKHGGFVTVDLLEATGRILRVRGSTSTTGEGEVNESKAEGGRTDHRRFLPCIRRARRQRLGAIS